jgi:hypothetical protein
MTQEFNLVLTEFTFAAIQLQVDARQFSHHVVKVILMSFLILTVDEYVVEVTNHVGLILQYVLHGSLEDLWG